MPLYVFVIPILIPRTVIGLRGKDGVVFAVEKLITSKLYEPGANKRILNIDQHVGMAVSGLISDSRQIAETARSEAASYRTQYGIGIPVKYLNDRVAMYMHAYTLYSSVRPYGCSVILGAWDELEGPAMYMIDSSGVSYGYYGCAIGKKKDFSTIITFQCLAFNFLLLSVFQCCPIKSHNFCFIELAFAMITIENRQISQVLEFILQEECVKCIFQKISNRFYKIVPCVLDIGRSKKCN